MGFGQGLSGLNVAAQDLDVIGNNIANSKTIGFKAGKAAFADIYANSRIGLGATVAAVNQRFTTGIVSTTGNQFDMALDGEKGFFVVKQPNGAQLYTRNGQFIADKDNRIINAQGQQLVGFTVDYSDPLNPVPSSSSQGLTVPVGNIDPKATTEINNVLNLDSTATVVPDATLGEVIGEITMTGTAPVVASATYQYTISGGVLSWVGTPPADGDYETDLNSDPVTITSGAPDVDLQPIADTAYVPPTVVAIPFDPNNPDSFTKMTPVTVYDSLGTSHNLNQYYVKRATTAPSQNNWDVYFVLDGTVIEDPAGAPGDPLMHKLAFTNEGRLDNMNSLTPNITFEFPTPPGQQIAVDLDIEIDYTGSTQFAGSYTQNFIQNGYATGDYASMSIGTDGSVVANYTNGATKVVGYVMLADFNNLQGLQPVGGNAWRETSTSGQPIFGTPGTNGLAQIKGQSVEESNVDLSQELVNMIIAQRTYQANTQTIKTQDQILQTLVTMR